MFFILSKTAYFLLQPLVWILFLLLWAVFPWKPKRRKNCLIAGTVLLLFFSNDFIENEAFLAWEEPPVPIATLGNYSTAIVLTGVTNTDKSSPGRVFFNKGADRVLHTVQLYKMGKIGKILISGGSGKLFGRKTSEAIQLKQVFLYCGIPDSAIIVEGKSRNTHENAEFSKKVIDSAGLQGPFLLVTSAFHIRRAEGCFLKTGIDIKSFPVDYYTHDRNWGLKSLIIPSEGALCNWSILIHEVIGYLTYKLMSYS